MPREKPGALVSAVVVAFNGGDELEKCIGSLLAQSLDVEVVVVDNASHDGSVEAVERRFAGRLRVARQAVNRGYAAGANAGWREARADVVAILNQDLVLAPDCLERMRDTLLASPREALVTPKLLLADEPSRVNAIGNDVHLSGVAWCHGLGTSADAWHGTVEVTAVSGAAFMARRSFLEALGGLEEGFFMYYEDVDLSLRARLAGATCLAACDAVALHDWTLELTPAKFAALERNRRALWLRLWRGQPEMFPLLLQAEAMGLAYAVLRGPRHLRAKLAAWMRPPRLRTGRLRATAALQPLLAREHPYALMLPGMPAVGRVGLVVDRIAAAALGSGQWNARG